MAWTNEAQSYHLVNLEEEEVLPKPPVPSLKQTMTRYLEYASVVCSVTEMEATRDLVATFYQDPGPSLQDQLSEIARQEENWVNKFWLPEMYLNNRLCLPGFSNPAYIFPERKFKKQADLVNFAACLMRGVCDYKTKCDRREIPQDKSTGQEKVPLCMEQYRTLFSCYREPDIPADRILTSTQDEVGDNEHIIVMCKNQAFVVQTMVGGERQSEAELAFQLSEVLKMANGRSVLSVTPMGVLTSANRDKAAHAMQILLQDETNKKAMRWIRSCVAILCLDLGAPPIQEQDQEVFLAKQGLYLLHGGGPDAHGCNRWYDKSLQFVVADTGLNGLNIEHSVADGIVLINLAEHALKHVDKNLNKKQIGGAVRQLKPKPISWHVSEELKAVLEDAKRDLHRLAKDMDLAVLNFNDYGKNFPKTQKLSPDLYIQLCLQLAYYRTHGRLVSTYESATLRRFRHGRVDNIRAATPETQEWVEAMENSALSQEQKRAAFQKAVEKHTLIMKENLTGFGFDNHVAALKQLSKESGRMADLFNDPQFLEIVRFPLSTSQVSTSVEETYLCYGPVVEDGYGCAYNPQPDSFLFAITAFHSCPKTSAEYFRNSLNKTLVDMRTFLETK